MKRSRRVVLTMMGSAAAGAVSVGWVGAPNCGRNEFLVTPPEGGRPYCRARSGFGYTSQRIFAPVARHHHVGHGGHVHFSGGG
jgi:hypothetical protein